MGEATEAAGATIVGNQEVEERNCTVERENEEMPWEKEELMLQLQGYEQRRPRGQRKTSLSRLRRPFSWRKRGGKPTEKAERLKAACMATLLATEELENRHRIR